MLIRRTPGQSMVEFALVVPFLITFVLGIMDFSYYVFTYSEVENAARRGSEFMSKAARSSCFEQARDEALRSAVLTNINRNTITFPSFPSPPGIGDTVRINVAHTGTFLTPVARGFFGNTFQINITSQRTVVSVIPPLDASNNDAC